MKNYTLLFMAIASVFSFSCFAQGSDSVLVNAKMKNTQLMSDSIPNNELVVVSYHVEEIINMKFGSYITTYDVSSLSLVRTNDLGPRQYQDCNSYICKSNISSSGYGKTKRHHLYQNHV